MTPRISVLMPVFNGGAYLEAAVASVLAQSFGDFELLIVDDGSTDRSREVVDAFAARDERVRLLCKANSGISDTLNLGLDEARGDWIARLDADDLMLPARLERQLAFLDTNPDVVAVGSYYDLINEIGERRVTRYPLPRTREELARYLEARELLTFTHPTMTYRRDLALALGGYRRELEPCEDADLFARMLARGGTILIQPEVLTLYRVHGGSISHRKTREMFSKLRFVFHNFYGARDGRLPISYAEFQAYRKCQPVSARLRAGCDYVSEVLYRSSTAALVDGKRLRAGLSLAGAAALKPQKAIRRALRNLPFTTPEVAG
ncbi:MAG TPA: glycosyltransferase [Stellaceae bacterium]|nr:glycosyltransferase [Stellaceae bacterium]